MKFVCLLKAVIIQGSNGASQHHKESTKMHFILFLNFILNSSLMDLPVTNAEVQNLTMLHSHMEQEGAKVTVPTTVVVQDTSSVSG